MKLFAAIILCAACALPAAAQKNLLALPGMQASDTAPEAKPAAKGDVVAAEWDFLAGAAQDKEKDVLELVLPQVKDWLLRNPEHPSAHEALLVKAELQNRLGDQKTALMALLRHLYEYPDSETSAAAKKLCRELILKKADKKQKPLLDAVAESVEGQDAAARLHGLLLKAADAGGELLYEPLAAEFHAFLNRFPLREGNDALRLALADLHQAQKEYLKAAHAYEKMIRIHPDSRDVARAKLSYAVTLTDNLKQHDKAITVLQDITANYQGSEQAKAAYARLPALAEKQKKYQLAVDVYEEIIERYPDSGEAAAAYGEEARVLREEMKKFPDAIAVLTRLADKYKGEQALGALLLAAEIYRKDLKDVAGEVAMYDRVVAEYDSDPRALKSLFAAAEVFDKAKDYDKARDYYQKVIDKSPEDGLAKKSQRRVDAIVSGKP